MNERLQELADQANTEISYRVDPHSFKQIDDPNGPHTRIEFNKEKFAELIIRECAVVGSKFSNAHPDDVSYQIKKYFGVK